MIRSTNMNSYDAEPQPVAVTVTAADVLPVPWASVRAVLWAGVASTLYRFRRGEGALLAINFSLIAYQGMSVPRSMAQALVSVLVLLLMYAFNDLYDAPTDSINPKKDRFLIATYLEHRQTSAVALVVLKLGAVGLAFASLGGRAALAVVGVLLANMVYSTLLKGVPVIDVAWCGLWGGLFATIVGAAPSLILLVGLMTAVCHLYQALDDRVADAANGITTTAVRSALLSKSLLCALSVLLFLNLRAALGGTWALSACVPLLCLFVAGNARIGWLLTKIYFGVVWLYLLGIAHAAG